MCILCLEPTVKTTEMGLEVEGLGHRTRDNMLVMHGDPPVIPALWRGRQGPLSKLAN